MRKHGGGPRLSLSAALEAYPIAKQRRDRWIVIGCVFAFVAWLAIMIFMIGPAAIDSFPALIHDWQRVLGYRL